MKIGLITILLTGCLGIGCIIAFRVIGSTIDSDGILHEPFYLLPVGWFLIALSALALVTCGVIAFFGQR